MLIAVSQRSLIMSAHLHLAIAHYTFSFIEFLFRDFVHLLLIRRCSILDLVLILLIASAPRLLFVIFTI